MDRHHILRGCPLCHFFCFFFWLHCDNPIPEGYELTSELTVSPPVYSSYERCFLTKTMVLPRGSTWYDILSFLTVLLNSDLGNTSCSQARSLIGILACLLALAHSLKTGTPLLWAEPPTECINLLLIQAVKKNAVRNSSHNRRLRPLMMFMSCARVLTGLKESGTDCSCVSSSKPGLRLWHPQGGKMSLAAWGMSEGSRVAWFFPAFSLSHSLAKQAVSQK